jgi:hypothetical protein
LPGEIAVGVGQRETVAQRAVGEGGGGVGAHVGGRGGGGVGALRVGEGELSVDGTVGLRGSSRSLAVQNF